MTKIYESVIVEGNHITLPYTQHLQYIFINVIEVYFQGTFNMYVKVDETHFYRKLWRMHWYYDFIKNSSMVVRLSNNDI